MSLFTPTIRLCPQSNVEPLSLLPSTGEQEQACCRCKCFRNISSLSPAHSKQTQKSLVAKSNCLPSLTWSFRTSMTYSLRSIFTAFMDSLSGTLSCFARPKSRRVPYRTLKICSQVVLLMGFKSSIRLSEPKLGFSPGLIRGHYSFQFRQAAEPNRRLVRTPRTIRVRAAHSMIVKVLTDA